MQLFTDDINKPSQFVHKEVGGRTPSFKIILCCKYTRAASSLWTALK